jgi:hypothetical protein
MKERLIHALRRSNIIASIPHGRPWPGLPCKGTILNWIQCKVRRKYRAIRSALIAAEEIDGSGVNRGEERDQMGQRRRHGNAAVRELGRKRGYKSGKAFYSIFRVVAEDRRVIVQDRTGCREVASRDRREFTGARPDRGMSKRSLGPDTRRFQWLSRRTIPGTGPN